MKPLQTVNEIENEQCDNDIRLTTKLLTNRFPVSTHKIELNDDQTNMVECKEFMLALKT